MTDRPLTKRQREVLEFIRECVEEVNFPPTVREIGEAFGIRSPNGVMCHLKALEVKGYINREFGASRAIYLCEEKRGIPMLDVADLESIDFAEAHK